MITPLTIALAVQRGLSSPLAIALDCQCQVAHAVEAMQDAEGRGMIAWVGMGAYRFVALKAAIGSPRKPPTGDPRKDHRRAYLRERMRKVRAGEWEPMRRVKVGERQVPA